MVYYNKFSDRTLRRSYDAEMQNLNHKTVESLLLPKRSRFYQSSIDMDHMDKGQSYKTLPDSTILFICTFDPFGKGLSRYTFREKCEEDPGIAHGDGATKIYYNCCFKGDDIPENLKKLYDYIETGRSGSELTERIDAAVERARKIKNWRSAYMKEMVLYWDAKDEGRAEEREKSIAIFIADKREDGIPEDVIREKLIRHFKLAGEEADVYLAKESDSVAATI